MLPVDPPLEGQAEAWEPQATVSLPPTTQPLPDSPVPVADSISDTTRFSNEETAGNGPSLPPAPPARARPPLPREQRARGPVMSTGRPKSRLPIHLTPDQVRARVDRERREALDVRDPIAITLAAERYNTIDGILAPLDPRQPLDLNQPFLSVSQTGKMLGYTAKEVRRLLGQGKIAGRKVGNEWRVPLWAVL